MSSLGDKRQKRATCIAFGNDLRRLFFFARRLVAAGQRPVLANSFELLSELRERLDLRLIVIDTPRDDPAFFVRHVAQTILERVRDVSLVFECIEEPSSLVDLEDSAALYFFEPNAAPARIKAVLDMATFAEGLFGSIRQVDLVDFLQLLNLKRGTSAILIRGLKCSGMAIVENGELVHACCGELCGKDALFALICQERGQFAEVEMPREVPRTIDTKSNLLLVEAMSLRDERSGRRVKGVELDDSAVQLPLAEVGADHEG